MSAAGHVVADPYQVKLGNCPGAVVFLDDHQLPAVARAASFFLRNLGWTLEEVSPGDALHQWAVLGTSRTADERPFDFYVEF